MRRFLPVELVAINHMSLLKKSVFPKNKGNWEMENLWEGREDRLWGFLLRSNFCEFLVTEFFNRLICFWAPSYSLFARRSRSAIRRVRTKSPLLIRLFWFGKGIKESVS